MLALESRVMPSSNPGAFATVDGLSGTSQHPAAADLTISPAVFSLPGRRLVVDVTLTGDPGSPAPRLMEVQTIGGVRLQVLKGPSPGNGTWVVELGPGTYRLFIAAAGEGPAPFHINVALAGDVNGDFRVTAQDIRQIRGLVGQKAGQPGYLAAADVDRNGAINRTDLRLARLNLGTSTTLRPLTVTSGLDPSVPTDGSGELLGPSATLVGRTVPGSTVRLDEIDDGSFEQSTVADATGRYQFTFTVAMGTTPVRIEASGLYGQRADAVLVVRRVSAPPVAPTVTLTGPPDGLVTSNNVTVTGQVSLNGPGAASLTAATDSGAAVPVSLDASGRFRYTTSLSLNGKDDGPHSVTLVATGPGGVVSKPVMVGFRLDTVPPAITGFDLAPESDTGAVGDHQTSLGTVSLVGQTESGVAVTLAETGVTVHADAAGHFRFDGVPLAVGGTTFHVAATDTAGNTARAQQSVTRVAQAQPDAVLTWNQVTLGAIQTDASSPPIASRALAMVQAAVFDAVNAVEGQRGYYVTLPAAAGASPAAAVAGAAHDVLASLYPAQVATFDAALAASLAQLPPGPGRDEGLATGRQVAAAIIALRANDGSTAFASDDGSTAAGQWRPTAPSFAPGLLPQWGSVTPFALSSPSQFRSPGPPALDSTAFADDVATLESLGSATSTARTADQTQIARFWADGSGTVTPAGHWNLIAQTVALAQGDDLLQNARLFAMLDVAMADSAIAAWDAKYTYNFWRPVTVIQQGDTADNPALTADPSWTPLLPTPNFPEYVSGHSTFSAAAAAVLSSVFGPDTPFTVGSPSLAGVTRGYTSFEQAAQEAGISRIYGGIHFPTSNLDGQALGNEVGQFVVATFGAAAADKSPPTVTITAPAAGAVVKASPVVTGRVNDFGSGVATLTAGVDGGAVQPVAFDPVTGAFSYAVAATADGVHHVVLAASDHAGNSSTHDLSFTLDTAPPALTITAPADNSTVDVASELSGTADPTGSALTRLVYAIDGGAPVPLAFDTTGAFSTPLALGAVAPGAHLVSVSATDAAGNVAQTVLHVTLAAPIPLTVSEITPADGSTDVGSTFRPKIVFSRPVDPATLTPADFNLSSGGQALPATIVPATDGTFAWLFPTQPMPGGAMVTLTVDGAGIKAADGSLLDAAGNGVPGSKQTVQFTTVSLSDVPGTSLSGIVADPGPDLVPGTIDDVKAGPDGVLNTPDDVYLHPIAGVTVTILGETGRTAVTDAQGRFRFDGVPTGDVKLALDGRTATNAPPGVYFPEMVMDLTLKPGQDNTVMGSMGDPQKQAALAGVPGVYLPRLQTSLLKTVDDTKGLSIGVDPTSAPDVTPEQQKYLRVDIAPNSLIGADGKPMASAQVGISTVPPSLVEDMLPAGVLQHTFDITIQAPGVATFATPAALTIPNTFGAAPGSKLNLLSFDHTTGRLVIEGTMTVSADGLSVTTDPGVGITHPGWHGGVPGTPSQACTPSAPSGAGDSAVPAFRPEAASSFFSTQNLKSYFFSDDQGNATLVFKDSRSMSEIEKDPVYVTIIFYGGKPAEFLSGITDILGKPQKVCPELDIPIKVVPKIPGIKDIETDLLYGVEFFIDAHLRSDPSTNLISDPKQNQIFVYRYVDASDDDHSDHKLELPPSVYIPNQPSVRVRDITTECDLSIAPKFQVDPASDFAMNFQRVVFTPSKVQAGDNTTVVIKTPKNGLPSGDVEVGMLQLLADGTPQFKINVNSAGLLDGLKAAMSKITKGDVPDPADLQGITDHEKALFATPAGQDAIAAATTARLKSLFADFSDAITVTDGPTDESTIQVNWSNDRVGKLGESGERVGGDGIDDSGLETALAYNWTKYSNTVQNFLLSKAMNVNYQTQVAVYFGYILSKASGLGLGSTLTTAQLANALATVAAHEVAHTLGATHTGWGNLTGPAQGDVTDVMADRVPPDFAGARTFHTNESVEEIEVGLKMHWKPEEAQAALASLINSLTQEPNALIASDATAAAAVTVTTAGTPHLAVLGPSGALIGSTLDAGPVAVDPTGQAPHQATLTLVNFGTADLEIHSVRLADPTGNFAVSSVAPGTVLHSGASMPLVVSFDPRSGGNSTADLVIDTSDPNAPLDTRLTGFGLAPGGHAEASVAGNNLGAQTVGSGPLNVGGLLTISNDGAGPLSITGVTVTRGTGEYTVGGLPADFGPGQPLVIGPGGSVSLDVGFQPSAVGLRPGTITIATDDPSSPVIHLPVVGTGIMPGSLVPALANDYVAIETPDIPGSPVLHQRTGPSGMWSVVLPAETRYRFVIFDPTTGLVSTGVGITAANGVPTDLAGEVFVPSTAPDTDGDGLPDDVEFAVGTSPTNPDTAGTGVGDFAAVEEGLNPLGNRPVTTGVVAALALPGGANLLDIEGNPNDPLGQTAYVATGAGLAVVDTTQFDKPIILGQLAIPTPVVGLAVDPTSRTAVVAAAPVSNGFPATLYMINVSDPTNPAIAKTVSLPAGAGRVIVNDGLAYVEDGTAILSVDLASGDVLQTLDLAGGSLLGFAREGTFLYTTDSKGTLRVVDISGPRMVARGSSGGSGQVFVGNGTAFMTSDLLGTFVSYDVSDPDHPRYLTIAFYQPAQGTAAPPFAANGSGLGVLGAGNPGGPTIELFNVSDPTNLQTFLTSFALPSAPQGIVVAEGLAYVADGASGLLVLNVLPFDTKGVPPTVSITSPVAGSQVTEGSPIRIGVKASDDVQVRNVELLVNGRVVANNVSFPFDFTATAPLLASGQNSVTIQARATDTGGNSTLSNALTYTLVPDTTGPRVDAMNPGPGDVLHQTVSSVELSFDKPIDPASATASAFTVVGAGPDGRFGTGDDVTLPIQSVQVSPSGQRVTLLLGTAATTGAFRVTASASALHDPVGNALDGEFTGTFPSGDGNPGGDFVAGFTVSNIPTLSTSAFPLQHISNIPTGGTQFAQTGPLLAVDLNGDGRTDFVRPEVDGSVSSVSVTLSAPGGGYADPVLYQVGNGPVSVIAGDVNGDGKTDLIVLDNPGDTFHRDPFEISVLLGNGDGTFQPEIRVPTGLSSAEPGALVLGDFNSDRKPDLALTIPGTNFSNEPKFASALAVFAGNGDGTFQAPAVITLETFSGEHHLAAADLNGDGKLDLVSGQHVFLGNGDGTFRVLPFAGNDGAVSVGDFEGNGSVDVVSTYTSVHNTYATLFHGAGDGTFTALSSVQVPIDTIATGTQAVAADLNGDGKPDLVVGGGNSAVVLLNTGAAFGTPDVLPLQSASSVAVGDVNGDGRPDVLVGSGNDTVIALGTGDGTFQTPLSVPDLTPGFVPDRIVNVQDRVVADVNGDGIPDVVELVSDSQGVTTLEVALGKGDGTFGALTPAGSSGFGRSLFVADLNGDGKPDVVLFQRATSDVVRVLFGNGDGTFGQPQDLTTSRTDVQVAALADVNGDGRPDLVEATQYGDLIVRLNQGDGSFGPEIISNVGIGLTHGGLTFGDFNGDGKRDVVENVGGGSISAVALGNGDGTFTRAPFSNLTSNEPLRYGTLVAADVNGDGKPDLVGIDQNGANVMLFEGQGDGTFRGPIFVPVPRTQGLIGLVTAADVNGDGLVDLVLTEGSAVDLLLSNGDGTFQAPLRYDATTLSGVIVADLDRDGLLDILAFDTVLLQKRKA